MSIEVPQIDILDEGIEAEAECGDTCSNEHQFKISQMFHTLKLLRFQSLLNRLLVALEIRCAW